MNNINDEYQEHDIFSTKTFSWIMYIFGLAIAFMIGAFLLVLGIVLENRQFLIYLSLMVFSSLVIGTILRHINTKNNVTMIIGTVIALNFLPPIAILSIVSYILSEQKENVKAPEVLEIPYERAPSNIEEFGRRIEIYKEKMNNGLITDYEFNAYRKRILREINSYLKNLEEQLQNVSERFKAGITKEEDYKKALVRFERESEAAFIILNQSVVEKKSEEENTKVVVNPLDSVII